VTDLFVVRNGLDEIGDEVSKIAEIIVRTAKWVHPDTFHALPVWYPETARKLPLYDARWEAVYKNTNKLTALVTDKVEPNQGRKSVHSSARCQENGQLGCLPHLGSR
jgi:hypothetical protein